MRCSCGYLLTYITDICPVCLPNGITGITVGPKRKASGMSAVADRLGLVDSTEDAIIRRINEIVSERDHYEALEVALCSEGESLAQHIEHLARLADDAYEAGYKNGLGVAIQAIAHDKEERQAHHAWDGMGRAISAVEAVRDGTFQWVDDTAEQAAEEAPCSPS